MAKETKEQKQERENARKVAWAEKLTVIGQSFAKGYYKTLVKNYGPEKAQEVHKSVINALNNVQVAAAPPSAKPEEAVAAPVPTLTELEELQKLADLSKDLAVLETLNGDENVEQN